MMWVVCIGCQRPHPSGQAKPPKQESTSASKAKTSKEVGECNPTQLFKHIRELQPEFQACGASLPPDENGPARVEFTIAFGPERAPVVTLISSSFDDTKAAECVRNSIATSEFPDGLAGCETIKHTALTGPEVDWETTIVPTEVLHSADSPLSIPDGVWLLKAPGCGYSNHLLGLFDILLRRQPELPIGVLETNWENEFPRPIDGSAPWVIAVRNGQIVDVLNRVWTGFAEPLQVKNLRALEFLLAANGFIERSPSSFEFNEIYDAEKVREIAAIDPPPWRGVLSSFENLDLRRLDFSAKPFFGTSFRGADLNGADFNNSILSRVTFEDADLTGTSFEGAYFLNVTCPNGEVRTGEPGC